MRKRADLGNADDLQTLVRVVEEAFVADLHRPHVVAREVVAHAGPFGALVAGILLHLPGPLEGLGFVKPERHSPHASGLLKTQLKALISTLENRPTLA
ncbi:hypothetical protein D9M72_589720 [compost metagenome]